ncbi:Hypothetical protein FKW44_015116 [Caligus rogercresseyi]|uniref:Uncharacterized protein n=1 Tax=Caligus rogercresseyi TaxID=217165 RepID=A0A7T8H000_CALRO|nr:Hypothetical protein FKW44_015116 [Caligus rogercresseyi]
MASADTAEAEAFVNNKFKAIIEEGGYKPEQVLTWMRLPYLEINALPHLHRAGRSQIPRI